MVNKLAVWVYLQNGDVLSAIGHWGVLLVDYKNYNTGNLKCIIPHSSPLLSAAILLA